MIGLLAGAHPVIPPTRAPDPSPESHRPLPLRRPRSSLAETAPLRAERQPGCRGCFRREAATSIVLTVAAAVLHRRQQRCLSFRDDSSPLRGTAHLATIAFAIWPMQTGRFLWRRRDRRIRGRDGGSGASASGQKEAPDAAVRHPFYRGRGALLSAR